MRKSRSSPDDLVVPRLGRTNHPTPRDAGKVSLTRRYDFGTGITDLGTGIFDKSEVRDRGEEPQRTHPTTSSEPQPRGPQVSRPPPGAGRSQGGGLPVTDFGTGITDSGTSVTDRGARIADL